MRCTLPTATHGHTHGWQIATRRTFESMIPRMRWLPSPFPSLSSARRPYMGSWARTGDSSSRNTGPMLQKQVAPCGTLHVGGHSLRQSGSVNLALSATATRLSMALSFLLQHHILLLISVATWPLHRTRAPTGGRTSSSTCSRHRASSTAGQHRAAVHQQRNIAGRLRLGCLAWRWHLEPR